jgi:hypothetical protein
MSARLILIIPYSLLSGMEDSIVVLHELRSLGLGGVPPFSGVDLVFLVLYLQVTDTLNAEYYSLYIIYVLLRCDMRF